MESEGLKFKVILSYTDTFEASLRLMRPHLKKQIKKKIKIHATVLSLHLVPKCTVLIQSMI